MSRQDDSPVDEEKRLAALRRYDVLDTPPDGAFDRVAALARRWFKAPVGLVSLVDEDRIWFKAKDGLSIPQIPREPGLCSSVVASDTVTYEVLDALNDPRTAQNSLVTGDFGLRFYAAAPIIVDSEYRIGTVCVLDFEPRGALSDDDRAVLEPASAHHLRATDGGDDQSRGLGEVEDYHRFCPERHVPEDPVPPRHNPTPPGDPGDPEDPERNDDPTPEEERTERPVETGRSQETTDQLDRETTSLTEWIDNADKLFGDDADLLC